MRKITCQNCDKQYDYDKNDFCPKCGSYNPPVEGASTQIERELLSRFADGTENQTRAQHPSNPGKTPSPRGEVNSRFPQQQYKPTGMGAAQEGGGRHTGRIGGCSACEEPVVKVRRFPVVPTLILVAVVALFVLYFASNLRPPTPAREPDVPFHLYDGTATEHQMGEAFSLNDVEVTVDDLWWQDLSTIPGYEQEGYRCLAVSVYITGGKREDNLAIASPYLELADSTQYPLDHTASFAHAQRDLGIYNITLSDYQWESDLMGEFVFFLPEEVADGVSLILEEYAPGSVDDPNLTAVHSIPLTLPQP